MANVEVILLERVPKLGQMGDIVKVKPGFARNYLLPEKKALRATDDNRKYFDSRRKDLEANNLKRKQEAEAVAAQMAGFQVVLIRQASESLQLYGSVTARDIADAAATGSGNKGIKIERSQVELPKPIRLWRYKPAPDWIGDVLPVDIRVPGCPPRPEALIEGLLAAVGRLAAR